MPGELISIAEARAAVHSAAAALPVEEVALSAALGRGLAEDVRSGEDLPPFDSSAMDGYAVRAGRARRLRLVGEARAGHPAQRTLGADEAIAISTGAMLPDGAEAVVPLERARLDGSAVEVEEAAAGANVRRAGEDVRAGTLLISAGAELGPAELAVLASLGRDRVRCAAQPAVAIVVTGDELVPAGAPLGRGQIRDSNAVALSAQAERAGARVVLRRLVADDLEETTKALAEALGEADVVCVSGGVSVGAHDHVKPALRSLGVEERFWGVSMKPGKPTWFGLLDQRLVFGLPGNPVSAMVAFHLFVRLALRRLAGAELGERRTRAVLDAPIRRDPRREQVVRCRLSTGEDGWHVDPAERQGSHVLTSMLGAGAFALVPPGSGVVGEGSRIDIELVEYG